MHARSLGVAVAGMLAAVGAAQAQSACTSDFDCKAPRTCVQGQCAVAPAAQPAPQQAPQQTQAPTPQASAPAAAAPGASSTPPAPTATVAPSAMPAPASTSTAAAPQAQQPAPAPTAAVSTPPSHPPEATVAVPPPAPIATTPPPATVASITPSITAQAAAPTALQPGPGYDLEMYPGIFTIGTSALSAMLGFSGSAGIEVTPGLSAGFLASINLAVGFPKTVTATLLGPEVRYLIPVFKGAWVRAGGGLALADGGSGMAPGLGGQIDAFVPLARGLGPIATAKILMVQGVPVFLAGIGAGFSQ